MTGTLAPALLIALALAGRSPGDAVAALDADLLAHDSATLILTRWCADLRLADPARVRAVRVAGEAAPADRRIRARLGAGPATPIRFRHVRLVCGAHVLSDARNWYRPDRLTPAMNRALDATDTPFGAVVAPLAFHRLRLGSRVRVRPETARPPPFILEQRAVLVSAAGEPFAFVEERYTRELIGPGPRGLTPPGR